MVRFFLKTLYFDADKSVATSWRKVVDVASSGKVFESNFDSAPATGFF